MKCFGLVDHLRSFAGTASLVRMVSVIMVDMAPFMTIQNSQRIEQGVQNRGFGLEVSDFGGDLDANESVEMGSTCLGGE